MNSNSNQICKSRNREKFNAKSAPHVIVAEDDNEMRSLLAWSLRKEGYDVTACNNGMDLLNQLNSFADVTKSARFDLIISDIRMPGVTGLEILEGMHQRKGFPPMILITAFGDEETHTQAQQLGAVAMFDKPFDIEDLIAKVHEIVSVTGYLNNKSELSSKQEPEHMKFPLDIVFRHASRSDYIEHLIHKKAARLNHFHDHIIHCRVVIDMPHDHNQKKGNNYTVKITLCVPGQELVVEHDPEKSDNHEDIYAAICGAFHTAFQQLKSYLEKQNQYKRYRDDCRE